MQECRADVAGEYLKVTCKSNGEDTLDCREQWSAGEGAVDVIDLLSEALYHESAFHTGSFPSVNPASLDDFRGWNRVRGNLSVDFEVSHRAHLRVHSSFEILDLEVSELFVVLGVPSFELALIAVDLYGSNHPRFV